MTDLNGNGNGVGRPTKYRVAMAQQAYHLALLGATDADIARALDVSIDTVGDWKHRHPTFLRALKAGKEAADGRVAKSLYHRAIGYEHEAVKIVADAKTGSEHSVPYIERYPPDTVAAIFWLKNRRPDLWRDKQNVEHSGQIAGTGVLAVPTSIDPKEWVAIAVQQQRDLMAPPQPDIAS